MRKKMRMNHRIEGKVASHEGIPQVVMWLLGALPLMAMTIISVEFTQRFQ